MVDEQKIRESLKKAKINAQIKHYFFFHVLLYLAIQALLAYTNYEQNQWEEMWFLYSTIGWGLSVTIHGIYSFIYQPFFNEQWEDEKIKEILDKQSKQYN